MKIVLPPWRKVINETFIPLIDNTDRYLICWGGRGSSKSIFAAKKLIFRCLSEPYFRYILYRRTYNTIKDSQFQTIKDIVYDWGLQDLFVFNVSPMEIRCVNGNKFICRGGDEPKKLKSVKDPTGVWYEEEIPEQGDFITITTSIRTTKAKYLQEIFTINPEVDGDYTDHWFWKQYFQDKPDGTFSDKTLVDIGDGKMFEMTYTSHHSTYLHNRWIPDSFIAQLIKLRTENPYYYTIYALGKWGNKSTGGNFWKHFNRAVHVGATKYEPSQALHLSFDFNVNPYMTLTIWQVNGKKVQLIDEICLTSPKNTTQWVCKEFISRYSNHNAGVFIYGDPSGKKEDTRSEKGFNDFRIIQSELIKYRPALRLLNVAPPVVMSAQWLNAVFFRNEGGIEILVSDKCHKSIDDFIYVKEDSDGTMHKGKVKDSETGITYEKYGHCFVGETLVQTIAGEKRIDEIRPNDLVLTRQGYKKVLKTICRGQKEVRRYAIGNNKIICTPDHELWTKEHDFKAACLLTLINTFCIFDENTNTWKEILLPIREESLLDTQTQKHEPKGFIILGGSKLMERAAKYATTFINTCKKSGLFQRALLFTISTTTRLTTKYQTSRLKTGVSILVNTCKRMNAGLKVQRILACMQGQKQANGTSRMLAESGTVKWLLPHLIKKELMLCVRSVAQRLKVLLGYTGQPPFAAINVESEIGCVLTGQAENGISLSSAKYAKQNLVTTNGADKEHAPVIVANVYDLSIEGQHEFFANNILVHNCSDSFRYFACAAFALEFSNYQRGDIVNKPAYARNTPSKNAY